MRSNADPPVRLEALARAGEAAVRGDGFFREVLEALPAAVYVTDAEGRILFYNQAASALWGQRPPIGSQWCGSWRLFWPDGRPMPHEQSPMAVAIRENREIRGIAAEAERPDGSRVPFISHPTPLRDADGRLIGAVNLLLDTSDRKADALAALKLAAIVESSDDAIVGKDLDGIIQSWNRGAERLFGYAAEEVVGKSITIIIPPDRLDEETAILQRLRRGERVEHYETRRRRKDGTLVDVSLSVSPIRDASGRTVGAAKIARDISERRQTHERQVLVLNEVKHRLKNTLATVQAIASQTMRSASPEEREGFSARLQALGRAHDLLSLENWDRAPLRETVRRGVGVFEEQFGARFRVDGHGDPWLTAGRAMLLTMALHELATNAAKYGALSTAEGVVEIGWRIDPAEPDRVSFHWRETGGPAVQPRRRRCFGSTLVERALGSEFGGVKLAFEPDGVRCSFRIPL